MHVYIAIQDSSVNQVNDCLVLYSLLILLPRVHVSDYQVQTGGLLNKVHFKSVKLACKEETTVCNYKAYRFFWQQT